MKATELQETINKVKATALQETNKKLQTGYKLVYMYNS